MPHFYHYHYHYGQCVMFALNLEEQVHPGTFEYPIHYLIAHKLDLSCFYYAFYNDYLGRPAIDPAILLKVILFVSSKGMTSSCKIEWPCKVNIILKVLACDTEPHWTTVTDFISGHAEAIASVFE